MDYITYGDAMYTGHPHPMKYVPETSALEDGQPSFCYRLIFVQAGNGLLSINDKLYPITAPALYGLNEKEAAKFHAAGAPVAAVSLRFHPSVVNDKLTLDLEAGPGADYIVTDVQDRWLLKPFFERLDGYYGCIPVDPSMIKLITQIMDDIRETLTVQPVSWPCKSRSLLMELLLLMKRMNPLTSDAPDTIAGMAEDPVLPIVEYLHSFYEQKLNIEELAKTFHTNKTTLNKRFRVYTGHSVMSYLNAIRMRKASDYLRTTTDPVQVILERTGFKDATHFARNFRAYSGYTPSEYRNRSRG
ncbi:helix-turn-helix transcriptional regulator [Cohnella faecalis]|uniref:AraC family transcriptional regulator n=1 Tax=Cohnella faecalis TaxID=2315694 RepID=A0A398CPR5_9BACL|nr:AraC family transcriptional regulator [Cohnella faecalis]RIE02728.1 AraC family transcriptional regulator [Cohnella faecalis]